MQDKSYKNEAFFVRIEQLRAQLNCSLSHLCEEIGLSRTHLYHLKSGKQEPTPKIWGRLEQAERSAGIGRMEEPSSTDQKSAIHNPQSSISSEARMERIEVMLERIAAALEKLAGKD